MQKEDCVFCKIVSGELPSNKIYENSEVLAFLDVNPVNIGHSLVIPKKHFDNIYETPAETLANMITASKIVSMAIKSKMKADGINVIMNNDSVAGQIIFHSHMHIIPRFQNDGLGPWKSKTQYKEGEGKDVADRIISAI